MASANPAKQPFLRLYMSLAVAGSAAYAMSTLFSAMKPVLLTRYVEQIALAESVAGLIVAMPFVGIASAALLMRGPLLRMPYWQIVAAFGGTLVLMEALTTYLYAQTLLVLVMQFAGGVSVGVLMGTTSRYIATTQSPGPLFGFVDMMAVFLMSFMVFGVGLSVEQLGLTGGYLFAAVLALLFTGAMFSFRGNPAERHGEQHSPPPLQISLRPLAIVLMGVLFVTFSGLGFAFMFTLARDLGMSYDDAGTYIGILLFLSAFACQLGGWASARFGPEGPLAAAFVTCALGWYAAIHASHPAVYLAALVPAVFSLQFNFPILLALSGTLDRHGQWAAIATPLLTSGFAWAAIVAGQIVSRWQVESLAIATALGMGVCLLLLWISHLAKPERAMTRANDPVA